VLLCWLGRVDGKNLLWKVLEGSNTNLPHPCSLQDSLPEPIRHRRPGEPARSLSLRLMVVADDFWSLLRTYDDEHLRGIFNAKYSTTTTVSDGLNLGQLRKQAALVPPRSTSSVAPQAPYCRPGSSRTPAPICGPQIGPSIDQPGPNGRRPRFRVELRPERRHGAASRHGRSENGRSVAGFGGFGELPRRERCVFVHRVTRVQVLCRARSVIRAGVGSPQGSSRFSLAGERRRKALSRRTSIIKRTHLINESGRGLPKYRRGVVVSGGGCRRRPL
jgi:hypothetical protein